MHRLAFAGLMMAAGFVAGLFVVSANQILGGFMGAILGGACAVIALAFPRMHDYPESDKGFWD